MTQDEKREELRSWEVAKKNRAANPPTGFTGGVGYPDPEIYAYVDRLNGLHRLATLQSCAGHVCVPDFSCVYCASTWLCASCGSNATACFLRQHSSYEKEDRTERHAFEPRTDAPHIWNGQLWLWPDEKLGAWFLYHAPELAALPGIEKLSLIYHVEGREIIDVQFHGAGHGTLDETLGGIICAFFERGNMECNRW